MPTPLGRITNHEKSGNEPLTMNGAATDKTILDFWRWAVSDIVSNATRGMFAEFIVATALGIDLKNIRDEWSPFDLTSPEGIKVEVKSSAFIQTWAQRDYSKISFSIRAARSWDIETSIYAAEPTRESHVYVFCLLMHKDQETLDPLNMDQWEFYVVPTHVINNYERSSSSITLASLRRLVEAVGYHKIHDAILLANEH